MLSLHHTELARTAEEKGWWMVQDTAWEGYEKIPAWIMQGVQHHGG